MVVLFFNSIFLNHAIAAGVKFTFVPQTSIVINQPAVYLCSVDTDGVTIQWTVNGNSSTSSSITNQGIVTEGAATQNSKLTIPGDPTLNGTTVTCIGSGVVNEQHYINSSSAVLYIQGIILTILHNYIRLSKYMHYFW